jgi:hypothetical protein
MRHRRRAHEVDVARLIVVLSDAPRRAGFLLSRLQGGTIGDLDRGKMVI